MAVCSVDAGGPTIDPRDAELHLATWTRDELIELRDMWTYFKVHDLAVYFRRTEHAIVSQYYYQTSRPEHDRWTPARRTHRAWSGEEVRTGADNPPGPVRTIHADEDEWWTKDYYR